MGRIASKKNRFPKATGPLPTTDVRIFLGFGWHWREVPFMNFREMTVPQENRHPHSGRAGRWFLAALGLMLALIGLLFVWLMGRSFLRAREMRSWPEVPCVIISSEVEQRVHDPQSPREYRHSVSFGYEWQGTAHTGDHLTLRGSPWSSKRELAEKRAAEFPAGTTTRCRVSPANPDFAVLKPDSLAPGYSIWFPGLFVVGGLGITLRALIQGRNGQGAGETR